MPDHRRPHKSAHGSYPDVGPAASSRNLDRRYYCQPVRQFLEELEVSIKLISVVVLELVIIKDRNKGNLLV